MLYISDTVSSLNRNPCVTTGQSPQFLAMASQVIHKLIADYLSSFISPIPIPTTMFLQEEQS